MSEPLLTPPNKSVNLVWKLGVSWVLAWKLWMSWVLNTNRLRHIALVWGHNLRLFLKFNYTSLQIFFEVIISGKCSHLIFLYIIRYDNISPQRPHDPVPQSGGCDPQLSGLIPFPPTSDNCGSFFPEQSIGSVSVRVQNRTCTIHT